MDSAVLLERRVRELEAEVARLRAERSEGSGEGAMMKALLDSIEARRGVERSLESANEWLHLAQAIGGVAAYAIDFSTMTNEWSPSTCAMYGFAPDQPVSFDNWLAAIHADDRAAVEKVVGETVTLGRDVDHVFRIVRGDGAVRHILDRGRVFRDADGRPARLVGINIDISDRLAIEQELRFSNDFLRSILAASDDCIKVLSVDGDLLFMSDNGQRLMEIADFTAVEGLCWSTLWPTEAQNRVAQAVRDAARGIRSRFEGACPTFAGRPRHWDVTVSPIRDSEGRVIRIVSVSRDITVEVEARERAGLINRELHHRIKNSLATVQALARATARHSDTLDQFTRVFEQRLVSLSDVHSLLAGDSETVELRAIVERQLQPYRFSTAIHIDGPAVRLSQEQAVALAMIFHELTTNACKYGGLSEEGEGLAVTWRIDGAAPRHLYLVWQERPALYAEPSGEGGGFGTKLIERLVASKLGGQFSAFATADGYCATLGWDLP